METPQNNLKKKSDNKVLTQKNTTPDKIKSRVASIITVDKELIEDINWSIDKVIKWDCTDIFQLQLLWEIQDLHINSFEYFPKIKEWIEKILENLPFFDVKKLTWNNPYEKQLLDYTGLVNKILSKNEIFNTIIKRFIKKSKFDDVSIKEARKIFISFWFDELRFYKFKNIIEEKKKELKEKDKYLILIKNINDLINKILSWWGENWEKLEFLERFESDILSKKDINIYESFPKIKECMVEIIKTIPLSWVIYRKKFLSYIPGHSHILRKEIKQIDQYIDLINKFLSKEEILSALNSRITKIAWKKSVYFKNFSEWQNLRLSRENKEKLLEKLVCFWMKDLSFIHPWINGNFLGLKWTKKNETYSKRILSKNSPNVIETMKEFPNINNINIIYKSWVMIECLISTKKWITIIEPIEPNCAAFAIDEKNLKKYITINNDTILIHFEEIPYEKIIHNNKGEIFLNDYI